MLTAQEGGPHAKLMICVHIGVQDMEEFATGPRGVGCTAGAHHNGVEDAEHLLRCAAMHAIVAADIVPCHCIWVDDVVLAKQ